ncbi:MAG: DUF2877 domain-containing protein [Albidovulum sp.]|nr:DUF2877 domain-containing protein [Albidovulum sp.]
MFAAKSPRPSPAILIAETVGPDARQRLSGNASRHGQVEAVFPSTAYVSLDSGLVCITLGGVDPGPISVATTANRFSNLIAAGLSIGQPVCSNSSRIFAGGKIEIDLRPSSKWSPPAWPEFPDASLIQCGISKSGQWMPSTSNCSGLGKIAIEHIAPEKDDLVGRAARESILAARDYVASIGAQGNRTFNWARRLIGLGPGLTPSGDDFLGGFLIALHAIGESEESRRLWEAIGPDARASTNPLSFALLESAAKGLGSASLHAVLLAIMAGENPSSALASLSRCGHTSGWDALAGAITVLDSFAARCLSAAA